MRRGVASLVDSSLRSRASSGWPAVARGVLQITLVDATRKLVDAKGRCIPTDIKAEVCDPSRSFHFVQPSVHYGAILGRLAQHFPSGTVFIEAQERGALAWGGRHSLPRPLPAARPIRF